jgi:peptidoglycan/LPS O-acetylase OafA/YrhL
MDEGSDPVAPAKVRMGVLSPPPQAVPALSGSGATSESVSQSTPFRLGNRPALTGIRAPGIALVLIFHANFQTFPGAWAALGVFFVLSGFLITTMLASEHQKTGAISLRQFYSRRGVRLLPPLFIIVVLIALYANFVWVFSAANNVWGDITAAVFYFADYRSAFGHEPAGGFLAQCWSLAVEEQFYVIWAVLLFVALKYGSRKLAYAIAIAGIVASVFNRDWIVLRAAHWDPYVAGRVYYAFDTRADALFLGCLLGLLATGGHFNDWKPRAKRILVWLALISFAVMCWIFCTVTLSARSLPLFWLPVSEVASAVIIVYLVIHPQGFGTRALSIPSIVLIGNMSYAIYLFHWPVYVAISPYSVKWPFWLEESVRMVIIMALVMASWYLVEQPLMLWRKKKFEPLGPGVGVEAPYPPVPVKVQPPVKVKRPVKVKPQPVEQYRQPRPQIRWVLATDLLKPGEPGGPPEALHPTGADIRPTTPLLATELLAPVEAEGRGKVVGDRSTSKPDATGPTRHD